MTGSATGNDSAGRLNAILRVRREVASAEPTQSEGTGLAKFQTPVQTEHPNRWITVNTAILICWLILLIFILIDLEQRIRSRIIHSSHKTPALVPVASLGERVSRAVGPS
jgi:hypothetical protein